MRIDRHLAINLRKAGKSYNDISRELNISKSTIHYWFKNNPWSEEIKRDLIRKAQIKSLGNLRVMAVSSKLKWNKLHEQYRIKAKEEFVYLKNNSLFTAGLMLYWGEGDKSFKNSSVRMCNSDPEIIRIFYLFLSKILSVPSEKIAFRLTLYPDLKEGYYNALWSKMLAVPLLHFRKAAVIQGRHPTKRLSYGVCSVEVYNRELKEKIFAWLKLYQQDFSKLQ